MKYADFFTATNGFPLESDATLGFMQAAYTDSILGIGKMMGSNMVVISGMVETGNSVSGGWILLNNEVIEFMAGTKSATFILVDSWVQKANIDGNLYNRYRTRKAQFGTGLTQFNYSALQRAESIVAIRERLVDMFSLENTVILKGCAVFNLTASTLEIEEGVVVINRKIIAVGSYSGNFPTYLKEDGTYSTTAPTANFIKFDPFTSQNLRNVLRRAVTLPGNISMQASIVLTSFDSTGLGKHEWEGFALANGQNGTVDLRGRMVIGFYPNGNTGDPIWDTLYGSLTEIGGAKTVGLEIQHMPSHNHTGHGGGVIQPGEFGLVRRSLVNSNNTPASLDDINSGIEPDVRISPVDIPLQGGSVTHENRPPFLVLAFIQRIN